MSVKGDKYFAGNALKDRGIGFVAPLPTWKQALLTSIDINKFQNRELKYIVVLNIN